MIHVLVPMSGQGTRYQKVGYQQPKPAIPVNGVAMIERLMSCFPIHWPSYFVMAENHCATELPELLKKIRPKAIQDYVEIHTEGPLRAIEQGLKHIPANEPVFVTYCDYGMVWDPQQFHKFVKDTDCDACVVSYRGFHAHYLSSTTYAYSYLQGELVKQVKEKGSFTENRENEFASSGAYYFKSAELLKQALEYQKSHNLKMNGEFYTSLTVEALLQMKPDAKVRVFEIPYFFQWGTPQDLWNYEYWEKTFTSYNYTHAEPPGNVSQVLMPMAGLGSRFKDLTDTPKPFIKIDGISMFKKALGSLPQAKSTLLVGLQQFSHELSGLKYQTVLLNKTPEGQALSTQAGIEKLDLEKDVLVSSCDHSIVLSPSKWDGFIGNPQCDAAIFTVKGYPGTHRNPKAYAYIKTQEGDSLGYKKIVNISVKQPVSETPQQDSLLVGTFWFKSAQLLNDVINDLVKSNTRVNGELYLDSVFSILIEQGLIVREIELDGYINWGDPESLAEALYWYEVFCGQRLSRRPRFPSLQWVK